MSILLDDLREDWLTAWAPDLIDHADASAMLAARSHGAALQLLPVPRPDGSYRVQPLLHQFWQLRLHQVLRPLRDVADEELQPSVFGYRRGADHERRYVDEWHRFSDFIHRESADGRVLVEADIARFFDHVSWKTVLTSVGTFAPAFDLAPLAAVAQALEAAGLAHLPAGYGDARLIANCVLAPVDKRLGSGFARWLDDYRLFAGSSAEAEAKLQLLAGELAAAGFQLNAAKTRVLVGDEAARRHDNSLAEIYKPQLDPPEMVRKKLRSAFNDAASEPISERRKLRYVIGRLERERDGIAVSFALDALEECPWEAPRLVSYLSCFLERDDVRARADELLGSAAAAGDCWMVARVGALVLHTAPTASTLRLLERNLIRLERTPAWGIAVRLIARYSEMALPTDSGDQVDARALVVACADRGCGVSDLLRLLEPATVAAAEERPFPLPSLRSLL